MRLVHTSDWHLGKSFFGQSLVEDQQHVLGQLLQLLEDERADALLVAGDLYDRSVPPTDAVRLLDEVLTELATGLKLPVVLIGGNHDSPERLGFGARLMAQQAIHLRTGMSAREPIHLEGCDVHAFGYTEPEVARALLCDDALTTHDAVFRRLLDEAKAERSQRPQVVVAHAFVRGGVESPTSERPIAGGLGQVQAAAFDGFDYVALGHLHRPQMVAGRRQIRYSGSPLAYSFEEWEQQKGVVVVELEEGAPARIRPVPLTPRRPLARVRGTLAELLTAPEHEGARGAYVEATLVVPAGEYVLDAHGKLQQRFTHLRSVRQELLIDEKAARAAAQAASGRDDLALLTAFFEEVSGHPPEPAIYQLYEDALRRVDQSEGEVG